MYRDSRRQRHSYGVRLRCDGGGEAGRDVTVIGKRCDGIQYLVKHTIKG